MLIHKANGVYLVREGDLADHLFVTQVFNIVGCPDLYETSFAA